VCATSENPFKFQLRAAASIGVRKPYPMPYQPKDAGGTTVDSVEALLRLLTPQNRELLAIIRDKKPQSIAELAELTGRAQPNLTRTLGKLVAIGFVRLKNVDRRKVPTTTIHSLRINIDPFSQNDRLEWA